MVSFLGDRGWGYGVVPVRALLVRTEDFQEFISTYPEVLRMSGLGCE